MLKRGAQLAQRIHVELLLLMGHHLTLGALPSPKPFTVLARMTVGLPSVRTAAS